MLSSSFVSRRRHLFSVLAVLCLVPGCLDFDKQTIFVVFPPQGDLQVLMVYEGLRVRADGKDPNKSLQKAKDELADLVRGHCLYLADPLFKMDLKPAGDEKRPLEDLLRKHVVIRAGHFLSAPENKLVYCQPMSIREPGALIDGLNGLISRSIDETKEPPDALFDLDTFERLRKAARAGHAWLRLEKGRVSLSIPCTPTGSAHFKKEVLKKEKYYAVMEFLKANPVSVDFRHDRMTVALGLGGSLPIRVVFDRNLSDPPKFEQELRDHAQTLGVPLRKGETVSGSLEEFERKHANGTK